MYLAKGVGIPADGEAPFVIAADGEAPFVIAVDGKVFGFLIYLPYSKLAHLLYRTTAMVFAERYGRIVGEPAKNGGADS